MKRNIIKSTIILLAFGLFACGGESKSNEEADTDVGQEVKDDLIEAEVETSTKDSVINEVEDVSEEVDTLVEEM